MHQLFRYQKSEWPNIQRALP